METGTRHVQESNNWQRNTNKIRKTFAGRQGANWRNPKRVLHEHPGIHATTESVGDSWTKWLQHDHERAQLDVAFKPNEVSDGMVNQLGVVNTSIDNYKKSKKKLNRLHVVGN
jgi:hypothetical protein